MKLRIFALVLVIAAAVFSAGAQDADVVYLEGWVDIKSGGNSFEARIGDPVSDGDTILTSAASLAELETVNGATITVQEDTIFTMGTRIVDGEPEPFLASAAGAFTFKFNALLGKEPRLETPSVVASVRGTEVTFWIALDGGTLVAVNSGEVAVEGAGEQVVLGEGQGVVVNPGETPGAVEEVRHGSINHDEWNSKRIKAFLEKPVKSLERISSRMEQFVKEIETLEPYLADAEQRLEAGRAKIKELQEKEDDSWVEYRRENVDPVLTEVHNAKITMRYWALSAQSLRNFVMARMYIQVMSDEDVSESVKRAYTQLHRQTDALYEEKVTGYLVPADI